LSSDFSSTSALPRELFSLKGYSLELGTRLILSDISLTLLEGERVFLSGNNGSGKTTLLRVLAGHYPLPRAQKELPRMQAFYLGSELSAYRDLSFSEHLRILNVSSRENSARLLEVKKSLDFSVNEEKALAEISKGEQVLCLLTLALLSSPRLLLLDEVLSHLDAFRRKLVLSYISQRCGSGELSVIITSHENIDTDFHFDRKFIMEGVILFIVLSSVRKCSKRAQRKNNPEKRWK
jgi:ABC-2 type transport system ATP-binding protein